MKKYTKKLALMAMMSTMAVAMTACGGGGGGSSTVSTTPTTPTTPTITAVINPFTGTAAPGDATTVMHGTAYIGAMVSAYNVQPDGSNGALLGTTQADSKGDFVLNLVKAPTGMVRVVTTGGSQVRSLDNSVQPVASMELVTPYLTTKMDYLVVSQITDIASRILTLKAQAGATLTDAFKVGMRNTLRLDVANAPVQDDLTVYFNVLRGTIKSDVSAFAAQSDGAPLIRGLDSFGIMYDLPAQEVRRIIAMAGAADYPLTETDQSGQVIATGTWIAGKFDTSVPTSVQSLMATKTPSAIQVLDSKTGQRVAPAIVDMVSKYMIMDQYVNGACTTGNTLILLGRYPFYGTVSPSECAAVGARIGDLVARIATNNSSKMR